MSSATATDAPAKKGLPAWAKLAIAVVVIAAVVFALKQLDLGTRLQAAIEWIRGLGAVGVIVYGALYVVATLVGVATPMTLAAGVIYGVVGGVAVVSPSSVAAATICFLLGRTLLRKSVEQKVSANKKFAAIEKAVGKNGFKIVALLRLSPAFPFTLLNYGLGLTSVSVRDYVLASFLGMLPGTLLYVYLGHAVGDVGAIFSKAPKAPPPPDASFFQLHGKQVLLVVGLAATIAVTVYITKIARAALSQELGESPKA